MSNKRRKPTAPAFLEGYLYRDASEGNRVHKSFILRKKHVPELKRVYGDELRISAEGGCMVIDPDGEMDEVELEWQHERSKSNSKPRIPSVDELIAKVHQDVWAGVLVQMAKYLDLSEMEPRVEVLSNQQCVAVGMCKYVHVSQMDMLDSDKNILDYRMFFRDDAICVMIDVNLK